MKFEFIKPSCLEKKMFIYYVSGSPKLAALHERSKAKFYLKKSLLKLKESPYKFYFNQPSGF